MIRILSLGAGVQSTTVALMSVRGVLPKLDHAIFADTGWEPRAVYAHLLWLIPILERAGIKVHRVGNGDIYADALRSYVRSSEASEELTRWTSMPYFTKDPENGKRGMIRRQCTGEYKIEPIEAKVRELLGLKYRQRWPKELAVEQWLGISFDEIQRMKNSLRPAIKFVHPLIEICKPRLRRHDCLEWLEKNGYPEPPRSACCGCPFRSDIEWRNLKDTDPEGWAEAVNLDERIRGLNAATTTWALKHELFLHSSLKPLAEVDLSTAEEKGQRSLFGDECHGVCGV